MILSKEEIKRRARIIYPHRIPKTTAVTKIQPVPNRSRGNALSIPIRSIDIVINSLGANIYIYLIKNERRIY